MRKQVMIACLALSGVVGSVATIQAQSRHYYRNEQHTAYVKHDGKKKNNQANRIGAGAGAAVGALVEEAKVRRFGAAAGGSGGFAYDRHKKNQARRAYRR